MNELYFLFLFVCFKCYCFVYNGLKQSFILQTKPNRFFQISSFHRVLTFILRTNLALFVETWVQVCCYVYHLCLHFILLHKSALILPVRHSLSHEKKS